MTRLQHTLLALVALGPLWLPLASAADPAPPGGGAPASAHEIVEQRWPDGTLRERRQVLRLADGSVVGDGPFERWFPDGTKEYEARFVRGRKDGTTIRWHRNGQVASRDASLQGPTAACACDAGDDVDARLAEFGRVQAATVRRFGTDLTTVRVDFVAER